MYMLKNGMVTSLRLVTTMAGATIVLGATLVPCSARLAKDPRSTPSYATTYGAELAPSSSSLQTTTDFVNTKTGIPCYDFEVLGITSKSQFTVTVDLSYSGAVEQQCKSINEDSPTSWTGLGWQLGFSSINVRHHGTTDIADDEYYYRFDNGAACEILRNGTEPSDYTFLVQDEPWWTIEAHYVDPDADFPVIDGWTLWKTDGSVFRYGDFDGTPNAGRYVLAFGNTIGSGTGTNYSKFYYQWDLASASDVNGSQVNYTYQQVLRQVYGNSYIGESYVHQIDNDNGDKILFDLADKSPAEGPYAKIVRPFDLFETKYLDRIRLLDAEDQELEAVDFVYSGETGEIAPLNEGATGLEKRLLTGLLFNHSAGTKDRKFHYLATGELQRVESPATGGDVTYTYTTENTASLEQKGEVEASWCEFAQDAELRAT